jgi:two-component system, OmpR family, sensor histidine kinase KdpD
MKSSVLRVVVAALLVAVVTVVGRLADVDLTVASLVLLVTVVVTGLLGAVPAVVAATLGFFALNWYFTPPHGSLAIERGDDVVALIVFVLVAGVIAWLVRRLDGLRLAAMRREDEVLLRLDLTNRLLRGNVDEVLATAAGAICDLFALSGCELVANDRVARAGTLESAAGMLHFDAPGLTLRAAPRRRLLGEDQKLLAALVAGLATSVERVQLETDVRDARLAAAVSRQRSGFLSAISHNLRTPLTAVKAAASALMSSWSRIDPEERRDLLETICDESERLERLVQNTLELSRIRAGGLEAHPEEVDIADLVRLAVRRLRPLARAHRVRMAVSDSLVTVRLDVTMAEQILLNLLENELRFAPPGTEILVSAEPVGDDAWELRVADHGPGVPVESRDAIFDEFTSVGSHSDRSGTGLGLAIVRALVTAQQGVVRYEETPGGGATFVCTFPLEPA